MSVLSYKAVAISGLLVSERAFEITNGPSEGDIVKVTLTKGEQDIDGDGVPDQINLKISGCLIDSQGVELTNSDGSKIAVPAKVESLMTSSLAEGLVDLNQHRSDMTDAAIHRVLRQKVVFSAWDSIPA